MLIAFDPSSARIGYAVFGDFASAGCGAHPPLLEAGIITPQRTRDPANERIRHISEQAGDLVCEWQQKNSGSRAGKKSEFTGSTSVRWNANGGDSAKYLWSAVGSIPTWRRILRRANFSAMDAFLFLDQCNDTPDVGIYADPPWPEDGREYRHQFTEREQYRLADKLASFKLARVVIRFGDHPLIRQLYGGGRWNWLMNKSKTQANTDCSDVLILNGASRQGTAQLLTHSVGG